MTLTPTMIGLTQAAGMIGAETALASSQVRLIADESIAPLTYYSLLDDGSKLRYVVGGLGVVSLTVLGGCQAPQPTPRNNESQIPPNQQSCANSHSEFCRSLQRTEERVELMREGRDEYNNHNQSLFWMAGAGGALATALLFATFFGVRGLRRKIKAKMQAAQNNEPPAPPPPPAAGSNGSKTAI